ncbi:hypothetical protein ACFPYI_12115 [Halomarina salina]|uniref:Uncharacterized protein n=1 Tax=Halomarina salina TaxID=1872699 RepID=A0ABD5RP83_9EURY|nr:hypothetical protein [Halomarina salina]
MRRKRGVVELRRTWFVVVDVGEVVEQSDVHREEDFLLENPFSGGGRDAGETDWWEDGMQPLPDVFITVADSGVVFLGEFGHARREDDAANIGLAGGCIGF